MWPEKKDVYSRDPHSFLFSLDKKKKYMIKEPDKAIHFSNNSLKEDYFNFGSGQDLYIYDHFTKNSKNGINKGSYDLQSNYELNGGKKDKFIVISLEIYQIEY